MMKNQMERIKQEDKTLIMRTQIMEMNQGKIKKTGRDGKMHYTEEENKEHRRKAETEK